MTGARARRCCRLPLLALAGKVNYYNRVVSLEYITPFGSQAERERERERERVRQRKAKKEKS